VALIRILFLLDKCHRCDLSMMRTYSISDAADALEVNRRTLYRWIKNKVIPAPKPGEVKGRLARVWTESDLAEIKEYMKQSFWGKGIDRRTGKKAKQK
jgi:excisionase family DNA binding protein